MATCLLGDYEGGLRVLTQAATALRASGNRPFDAYTLIHTGEGLLHLGRTDEARWSIGEGIRIGREVSLPDAIVAGLTSLAMVLQVREEDERAEAVVAQAIELAEQKLVHFELARAVAVMARMHLWQRRYTDAAVAVERALGLCRDGHFRLVEADTLLVSAAIRHADGDRAQAVSLAGEALEIFQRAGCRFGEAEAHNTLAALATDRRTASRHARAAQRIYRETGAKAGRGAVVSDSSA